jgi:nucleoside-diphosphate-sugar epimerase
MSFDAYAGKSVLVTGGAGAIGSRLTRSLLSHGARVTVLDDLSAGVRWNVPDHESVVFVRGCVTDEVDLKRVFGQRPEVVFHLAAFFANQNSIDYPERDLRVNGLGTLRVFEYAELAGVDRVVYASSGSSVYGNHPPVPFVEDFISLQLSTPYQITKMLGELYANFFHHHYGLKVVKLRFFNNYGPGELPGLYRNVIPNFIYRALQGKPLVITGTGEETRDFTFVDDTTDGLLRSGLDESAVGREFNLASGREVPIRSVAEMINGAVGNEAGITFVERRRWDTKPRVLASVDRARDVMGYVPKTPFDVGLAQTIEWFRENWAAIQSATPFVS